MKPYGTRTLSLAMLDAPIVVAADENGPTLEHADVVLVPDGQVKVSNGPDILVDAKAAKAVIEAFEKQGVELPVDYDHQTLGGKYAAPDGRAPAAGWITALHYKPGAGILAKQVRWTNHGAASVHDRDYKYLSPVLVFDKATNRLERIHSAALTNKPAIRNMAELKAASDRILGEVTMPKGKKKDISTLVRALQDELEGEAAPAPDTLAMLIGELAGALKQAGATVEEGASVEAIVKAAIEKIGGAGGGEGEGEAEEAAASLAKVLKLDKGADWPAVIAAAERVALGVDGEPAKQLVAANQRIEALEALETERTVKAAVTKYVDAGKLNEHDEKRMEWAAASGARDLEGFKTLMDGAPVIIPQGRTNADNVGATGNRRGLITQACAEYNGGGRAFQRLTSCRAFVTQELAEQGLSALTEDEVKLLN